VLLVNHPFPGLPYPTAHFVHVVGDSPALSVVSGKIANTVRIRHICLKWDWRCSGGSEFVKNLDLRTRKLGFERLPAHASVALRTLVLIVCPPVVATIGEQISGEEPGADSPSVVCLFHLESPPSIIW